MKLTWALLVGGALLVLAGLIVFVITDKQNPEATLSCMAIGGVLLLIGGARRNTGR